ncbi:MAG TPA: tRNA pseudouridine(38-40) synthase TruA [Smithella sp.]|jgi:tRNA pseudouridine38-40 synthase|nr:tRNA pseudouridine(38-40) synthase TruA [Smithella sp.]HNQ65299.1 tRNA pseudouridine(38-40) synthase TruA [Smithella sp.]HOE32182.1 tRNA pseudouridine(38-40) synthase TruA [Smithella sp.]HOG10041.1 tRNA pseudouridine(38-40) synthase TruA [Smithella sp.]HOO34961.1 tRNA pseudouridine(38-40) synthase TruA [Smithella sp.]
MRNFKITVEYDGAAYCGWQRQHNGIAIQQLLEEAIKKITGQNVSVIGSGRTDAGVHAMNQVGSFKCDTTLPVQKIFMGVNSVLPPDIVVKNLEERSDDFHALRDVKSKVYVYRICNQRLRPVLGRNYFWHVRYPLDIASMRKAVRLIIGTHDFSCFCAAGTDVKDRVRTIVDIEIMTGEEGLIEIQVESHGFLKYMVRNIIGTLIEVGRGKRQPEEMKLIIESKNRNIAGATAPACGLFLKEVKY